VVHLGHGPGERDRYPTHAIENIMKTSILLLVLAITTNSSLFADEARPVSTDASPLVSYIVTASEYKIESGVTATSTEAEIIASIEKAQLKPTQTIRVTAISAHACTAQFTKSVTVTTGKVTNRDATSRIAKQIDIGATIELKIEPGEDSSIAMVRFQTSRLQGEGTDDSPPDVVSTDVETTQVFEQGKPRLIASTDTNETSYIFVTITPLP
jgi:hypothetical protein